MPFAFDEDQRALADGVESLLSAKATGTYARAVIEGEADWLDLWEMVAELGIPGMAVPEEWGGLGLGPVELVAVCERVGRHLAPGPLVATAGGFVQTAVAAGGDAAGSLEAVAANGRRATLVYLDPRSVSASLALSDDRLSADSVLVPDAERVELFGFVVEDGVGGYSLAVLPAECAEIVPVEGFDATRPLALVSVGAEEAAVSALPRGLGDLSVAFATAAAELVGLAARMLELSVKHAQEREQFGSPIGAFQGVKHRLVDALLELERARSLTYRAAVLSADASDADPDAELRAARMAKAAASDAATEVGRAAVQVHGGVGITVEHDVSLYYLRARQASMQLGGRDAHYAALVDYAALAARGATG